MLAIGGEVVTAGVASLGGGPMHADAIMRIQSMTKVITAVSALRLVPAGRLTLDQSLVAWLPELTDRQVLRTPTAALDDTEPARRAITLRHLAPAVFAPYAQRLAGIAAAHAPQAVLEVAAGTGIVTAELVRALPAEQITATDLNPAMVAWAAQRVSGPRWMPADAQRLQFKDASFDMIVCQFGVMFFPDKSKAFAEAARVLRPDGVFVFTAWDTIDIAAGGLVVESIERLVLRGTAPSARVIAEGFCYGTPLRFELQERGDIEQFTDKLAGRMTLELGAGPVEGDMAGYVVSARRPG